MQNKKLKQYIAVFVLSVFFCILVYAFRTELIIQFGIVLFRAFRNIVLFAAILINVLNFGKLYINITEEKARTEKELSETVKTEAEKKEKEREEKRKEEKLSISGDMDSEKIKELIQEHERGDWRCFSSSLSEIHFQLDTMDDQQEKLGRLLKNNGADGLFNTQDVLDRAEQYLCKNARKVINYMDVADPDSGEDCEKVREKITECLEEGEKLLDRVQEFLFSLADFLNSQGDDDDSMQMLEIYKNTILDSIGE